MPLKEVEYDAKVRLVYEVVYEQPAALGMQPEFKRQEDMWDDDADRLDDGKLAGNCPPEAWGWFTQQRFDARVEHNGKEVQLTSLPTHRSGTVFLDGEIVTEAEVNKMIDDQRRYVASQEALDRPIGALPHGTDKRPLLVAMQQGEQIVKTRTGNYRAFDRKRGDSIVASP
jgi:hypothetical protein